MKRNWQQEYAKALREDGYSGAYVPVGLHQELHKQLKDVPLPDKKTLRDAYLALYYKKRMGVIAEDDSISVKLDFLISLFGKDSPTGLALRHERAILLSKNPLF